MSKGNGNSNRTQIIIAIISLIGVLGAALIANWSSIFPNTPGDIATPSMAPTATPVEDGANKPQDEVSSPSEPQQPQTGVDLSFVGWAFDPQTPVQEQALKVRVGIENIGTQPSGAFKVEWWPGVNYTEPAIVWEISNLAPGENQELNYTYPGYPSWYGQIQTKVVIDPNNSVQDFDRDNNEWIQSISVSQ